MTQEENDKSIWVPFILDHTNTKTIGNYKLSDRYIIKENNILDKYTIKFNIINKDEKV